MFKLYLSNHKYLPHPLSTVAFVWLMSRLLRPRLRRRYFSRPSISQKATSCCSATAVTQTMSSTCVLCRYYIVLYQSDYGERASRFISNSLWRRVLVAAGAVRRRTRVRCVAAVVWSRRSLHCDDSLIRRRPLEGARSQHSGLVSPCSIHFQYSGGKRAFCCTTVNPL